jgi:hypothetical protein
MRCKFHGSFVVALLTALGIVLPTPTFKADVTTYTDAADFASALTANGYAANTQDFESSAPGSTFGPGSVIGDIDFDGFTSPDLLVDDSFATTSGNNYLGLDNIGLANQFPGGFEFDMQLPNSNAVGMFIITAETPSFSIFDNDIVIDIPGVGVAELDVDDLQATIGGSDNVFFVGLVDTMATFNTAQIRYDPSAISTIVFNIDDIVTASGVLLGDVNQDGLVNLLDIEPFVTLLTDGLFQAEADINQDGSVNLLDVGPFIDILSN